MKSLIYKDKKRRKLYAQYEKKKYILKYINKSFIFPITFREKAKNKLFLFPRNSSITRIRNRCILTNRSRSIYRKFKFSRLMFRSLALNGFIPGVRKAIW